jgi:NAD-dependent deacetylase
MSDSFPVSELAARLRTAARLTVLTGAGVSAASGVPTFRGAQGLWRGARPEELATADAFRRDPAFVWGWYAERRATVGRCHPNEAHHVIARWSTRPGTHVVTQNVDDLHVQAGTARLVRLHGSLWELACWDRCGQPRWRDDRMPLPELPPRCPRCTGLARPGVVWFGESLAAQDVEKAARAARCDVFMTIGTSAVVHPAAGLVEEARRHGAWTVEVNPDATPSSSVVHLAIRAPAEQLLPAVEAALAVPSPR